MKRIAIFTSALLLTCGMTGCGNSSTNHDAVYTDVNPFNENEVRHIEERNVDAEPPEEWLYTEIAVDEKNNTYLRYITSVETMRQNQMRTVSRLSRSIYLTGQKSVLAVRTIPETWLLLFKENLRELRWIAL